MKRKLWKEIVVAVLLVSTILSFSPIAYGEKISVQQSIDAIKIEMKKAAMSYVEPALKGELVPSSSLDAVLTNVKKNYQETRKIILASSLSEKEKQAKLKELEALYQEKIVKGLIPYIDAYNYATKYLDPLLKEIREAEANNDFAAVEKAYHELSVQLKSRTSILYRFTGKAPRDLLLEKYKKPADAKRDELIIPVTIMMKLTNAQQLFLAGKKEEAMKAIEDIPSLLAKLTSTNAFHQALIKEIKRLQAIVFPAPVTPVVPTPPVTGGGGNNGSSETSAQRALRLAKTNAINELANYKVEADYSTTNWTSILNLKTTGKNAINTAKTTTAVTQALNDAKAEVNKVKTVAQELLDSAKTNAIKDLTDYKIETDYSPANWTAIEGFKADGIIAINSATTIMAVAQALSDAQSHIDAIEVLVVPPIVLPLTIDALTQGVMYTGSVAKISGGTGTVTYEVVAGAVPTGLTLSSITGAITGTPTGIGIFNFTVMATDSAIPTPITKMQTYTGNVIGQVISIVTISGIPQVSQTLTAGVLSPTGATVSYQWQEAYSENGTYTNITNETDAILQLSEAQAGKYIQVVATGTGLYTGSVTSMATTRITSSVPIVLSDSYGRPLPPVEYKATTSDYRFIWGDYIYWPFDNEDNGDKLIIVAYDTQGNVVKSFNLRYRYVTNIVIDHVNSKITFTTLHNGDITYDWSFFEITN